MDRPAVLMSCRRRRWNRFGACTRDRLSPAQLKPAWIHSVIGLRLFETGTTQRPAIDAIPNGTLDALYESKIQSSFPQLVVDAGEHLLIFRVLDEQAVGIIDHSFDFRGVGIRVNDEERQIALVEHPETIEITPVDHADPACRIALDRCRERIDGIRPSTGRSVQGEVGEIFVRCRCFRASETRQERSLRASPKREIRSAMAANAIPMNATGKGHSRMT